MKRGITFTLSVTFILLVSGCSIGGSKTTQVSLGNIPYTWTIDKDIASHLTVEVPTNDYAKSAIEDGSHAQALVYYKPEFGERSIFMTVYYFSKLSFEAASHPDEPPNYGTRILEADGMTLSAAGPQDSIYDPASNDGKNVEALYTRIFDAKNYILNPKLKKEIGLQKPASIVGCYVAKLKEDRFILHITKQESLRIEAEVAFRNAFKDSSNGKLVGTYDGTILTGIYTFASEGTTSRSELFFKRFGETFKEGFGPAEMKGDLSVFTRPLNIRWDDSFTFNKSTECQL